MSIARWSVLALVAASAGCPNSSSHEPDFSVVVDLGKRGNMPDTAPPANAFCQPTCSGTNSVCCIVASGTGSSAMCVAPGGCPDGGVFASCTQPSDCSGQTPICCETIRYTPAVGDGGTMVNSGSVACTASCPAGLDTATQVYSTKICAAASDCAGYMGPFPTDNGPASLPFDGCCSSPRAPGLYYCIPTSQANGLDCL